MKLALALFAPFACSLAAAGQTSTTTPTATHHSTTASGSTATGTASTKTKTGAATASALPKVVGIPHTLYALKYIDTKIGTGPLAEPNKWYTVHYTGWFPDGKKFDSSYDRKEPITFPYGAKRVISGWDTGFEGMHVGGKRRLFVPYQLGYGLLGNPAHGMPAKANLVFDVELISFSDTPPASMLQKQGAPAGARPAPGAGAPPPPQPGSNAPAGQEPAPAAAPAPGTKPTVDPATAAPGKPQGDPTAPTTAPSTPPTPQPGS